MIFSSSWIVIENFLLVLKKFPTTNEQAPDKITIKVTPKKLYLTVHLSLLTLFQYEFPNHPRPLDPRIQLRK